MIRPNTKIGIVYSDKSKQYASELRNIIVEFRKEGYCIEEIVIDNNFQGEDENLENRVFNNLVKCNYAFVFLTKDLMLAPPESQFVSKPNVIMELGFLWKCIGRDSIKCIADFPHYDIEKKIYLLPSDINGNMCYSIDTNNSYNNLKVEFKKFLKTHSNSINRFQNYNADDLISSLILNRNCKTDYRRLFTAEQFNLIKKYSLKYQASEILEIWKKEKEALSDVEQIVYLFERIVFLPFFSGDLSGTLNDLMHIELHEDNPYINACYNILRSVDGYRTFKGQRHTVESSAFYYSVAEKIQNELGIFAEIGITPIIECIAYNYMGLAFLNTCLSSSALEVDKASILKKAKESFLRVIETSEKILGDSTDVFLAFAKYNMARVYRQLGENAESEYMTAISKRTSLASINTFPDLFQLNFSLETIHAKIECFDYLLNERNWDSKAYDEEMQRLYAEHLKIKQTPAADVSLFKTLDDKFSKK